MAPPKLPGNAPIADVLHPVLIHLSEAFGHELDFALSYHLESSFGQRFHPYEPLFRDERFYRRVASVAPAHRQLVGLNLHKVTCLFQVLYQVFAAIVPVHSPVLAGFAGHIAVGVDDADEFQAVLFSHLEVVGIVSRCDFHGSGAESRIHVIVCEDREPPSDYGEYRAFADESGDCLSFGLTAMPVSPSMVSAWWSPPDVPVRTFQRIPDIPQ